jgi:predicted small metal-binding protein
MIIAFKEIPIGKFSLRFYRTDHVWTCTINEDVLNEIRELTRPQEDLYNPYAVPHFVLNPPTELPVSFIAEEKALTDEEIMDAYVEHCKTKASGKGNLIDFARAILKKAQKK